VSIVVSRIQVIRSIVISILMDDCYSVDQRANIGGVGGCHDVRLSVSSSAVSLKPLRELGRTGRFFAQNTGFQMAVSGISTTRNLSLACGGIAVVLSLLAISGGAYMCAVCFGTAFDGYIFTGQACRSQQKVGGPLGMALGSCALVLTWCFINNDVKLG